MQKLVVSDFDGTLCAIRRNPEKVRVSKKILRTIRAMLEKKIRIIIISGRTKGFLKKALPKGIILLGSRGNPNPARLRKKIFGIKKEIYKIAEDFRGVRIKQGALGIDIDYRNASGKINSALLKKAIEKTARLRSAKLLAGRKAFEIVPREALDKKETVKKIALGWKGGILFLGDDESDARAAIELLKLKRSNIFCFLRKTSERGFTPRGTIEFQGMKKLHKILKAFTACETTACFRRSSRTLLWEN